jgi:hypothetical protein
MNTLQEHWDEYKAKSIPENISIMKLNDAYANYHTGAFAMFYLMADINNDTTLTDTQVNAIFTSIQDELLFFVDGLGKANQLSEGKNVQ